MSINANSIDLRLHMTVKSVAVFQDEINCKIDELLETVKTLQKKEKEGKKSDYLLENISELLDDLQVLFSQKNALITQIEKMKRNEIDLMK
jgi:hypothetical protein